MFLLPCFWSQMDVNRPCGDFLVTALLTTNVEKKISLPTEISVQEELHSSSSLSLRDIWGLSSALWEECGRRRLGGSLTLKWSQNLKQVWKDGRCPFLFVFLASLLFNNGKHKRISRQWIYGAVHVHSEVVQGSPAVWSKSDFDDSRLTAKYWRLRGLRGAFPFYFQQGKSHYGDRSSSSCRKGNRNKVSVAKFSSPE